MTWVWQAGGIASRGKPIMTPDDAKGLKLRGADKPIDLMLQGAGGSSPRIRSSDS